MKIFIVCCLILLCSCNHKDDTVSYIHSDDFTICHYQNVKDTAYINLSDTPSFLNGVLGGSLHLGFKYKM